ncbi:SRPBCC family protein [Nocardia noduli]|uniref:SRPBCC family protein n=1 Tax=Nocardia noduli TaxID=2815722 RepID=UPI001C22121A|nr:SRPBCC family protein [Nocardia noduli]
MVTRPVRHVSVNIAQPFVTVAAFLGDPANYPSWATGLAGGLAPAGADPGAEPGEWLADAPQGSAYVRFSPPNDFGIADHRVRFPDGSTLHIPLRAIGNEEGTTVVLTLFRRAGVTDDEFETDAGWVRRDLDALRDLLER